MINKILILFFNYTQIDQILINKCLILDIYNVIAYLLLSRLCLNFILNYITFWLTLKFF